MEWKIFLLLSHANFSSMTWTYVRTLDGYTLAEERQTLLAYFESGDRSIIKNFLWVAIIYVLLLPLLESSHWDANVSSSIPSTCLQKNLHHSTFLPFSLLVGRISGPFLFPATLCTFRCFPCAARYVCTKLNVKSSYNQIEQWMKWWDERKQQLLPCRSSMRQEGVIKYVPLV